MRGAVVLKAMALLVALGALGGVMVSGKQLLGAAPVGDAGVVADAGMARDAGRGIIGEIFGHQGLESAGNVYAPASKSFGAMGGLDQQGLGGLGLRGSGSGGVGDTVGIGGIGNARDTAVAPDEARGPVVLGSLDKELVSKVLRARRAELSACYEEHLKEPVVSGRLVVKFVVSASGTVSAAEVSDSTFAPKQPALEACLVGAVKRMQFPKPKGGGVAVVRLPFSPKYASP